MIKGKRSRPENMKSQLFLWAITVSSWTLVIILTDVSATTNAVVGRAFPAPPTQNDSYFRIPTTAEESSHIDLDELENSDHSSAWKTTTDESSAIITTPISSSSSSANKYTPILVVATLDGTFYGLDTNTGKTIWKQQSHVPSSPVDNHHHTEFTSFPNTRESSISNARRFFMPMLSTTTTTRSYVKSKSSSSSSSSKFDISILAIPSIDGRVFLTPFTQEDEEYYHKLWRTLQPTTSTTDDHTSSNPKKHPKIRDIRKKNVLWTPHKDWTLSSTTRDIVDHSPFFDSQGRLYIGSSTSMTAALDRDTGELVHIFPKSHPPSDRIHVDHNVGDGDDHPGQNNDTTQEEYSHTTTTNTDSTTTESRNLVWIGREDYTVSIFHPPSLQEDVRFSTSQFSSITDRFHDHDPTPLDDSQWDAPDDDSRGLQVVSPHRKWRRPHGLQFQKQYPNLDITSSLYSKDSTNPHLSLPSHMPNSMIPAETPPPFIITGSMTSTPDGQLAMHHPETGQLVWMAEEPFTSPVVFAMDAHTGHSLLVDILPDISMDNIQEDAAMVGTLSSGQLFAIPLYPNHPEDEGAEKIDALERLPRLISSKATHAATGDVTVWTPEKTALARKVDWLYPPHNDDDDGNHAIASISPRCNPSMNSFPYCLVNPPQSDNDSIRLDSYHHHTNVELMNLLAAGYVPPDIWFMKQRAEEEEGRSKKSRYKFIIHLLLSWVPPAVTLSFVISFELGRRKREQRRKQESLNAAMNSNVDTQDSGGREPFVSLSQENIPSLVVENSADVQEDSSSRLIYVSDTVLGYGGHGTVVFKGSLAGRHVAVKRMLKNYHASADREISLLIESDGHPNVVRYFFKEIRGDFVYLALEMCDASLQDLILSVQRKMCIQAYEPQVLAFVTRKVLFHIALGVKHLHELRIVHRDLKPQNILMAHKNRGDSFCNINSDEGLDQLYHGFVNDQYLPKISDMGLGKQLTSQSSYGISAKGEGSTIGGAGPGSVGWQAPEIMARRSMDLPIRNIEQSQDSKEGSPILEGSLNTRTSRSVDIFSLGCVFFSTLLPGSHPFGEWYEREANIMKNQPVTSSLEALSVDAFDLVSWMIERDSKSRPTATQVCEHPYFWDSVKRSSFLCDFSDRIEAESLLASNNGTPSCDILALERNAQKVVGDAWNLKVDQDLLLHLSRYRSYDPSSVRDCLRMIRNKHHHFDEIPIELRQRMFHGSESLQGYFESKFPRLVQHCYSFCRQNLTNDDPLTIKYHILSIKSTPSTHPVRRDSAVDQAIIDNHAQPIPQSVPILSSKKDLYDDLIIWEGSTAAKAYNCRGWLRSQEVWVLGSDIAEKKRDVNITRCLEDPKFRTRLCNHWDTSQGVSCPMRKKYKCVFAHGPVELRVKEGKRDRWGKLCDKNGNNSNPCHSGGEDTYGAAKLIENTRHGQGKVKL